MKQDYDVVIVGAGMVGASFALMLTNHALAEQVTPPSIALLEARPLTFGQHPGFDARAIALSAGSRKLFESFGIWPILEPFCSPIQSIQASDQGHFAQVDIGVNEFPFDALGQVIEIEDAGRELHQQLTALANVTLFCPTQILTIETRLDRQVIHCDNGIAIECTLLVGADGSPSVVAEHAGLGLLVDDFKQTAVIANLEPMEPHTQRAFERFTPDGPVALLPMTQNRWSLVWCMQRGQETSRMALDDGHFIQELHQVFGFRAGYFMRVGVRESYPLQLRRVQRLVSHRALVLGNAAHSLHPVAGQGFNLGLRDAATLARRLIRQQLADGDLGEYSLLAGYQSERGADMERTMMMTSMLAILFAQSDKTLAIPRNLTMKLMQHIPLLKAILVKQSLGLG